jgi:cytochrome c556
MGEGLKIYLDDATGAVATFGPVVYVVWRAHNAIEPVDAAERAVVDLGERYGEGRVLFYVHRAPNESGMIRSNPEVRDAMMRHFERHDRRFLAAAVAIEAEGFSGSIIRSVTAGVLLVRKTAVRTESFKDARDAVRWLGVLSKQASPFDAEAMVGALSAKGLALAT